MAAHRKSDRRRDDRCVKSFWRNTTQFSVTPHKCSGEAVPIDPQKAMIVGAHLPPPRLPRLSPLFHLASSCFVLLRCGTSTVCRDGCPLVIALAGPALGTSYRL